LCLKKGAARDYSFIQRDRSVFGSGLFVCKKPHARREVEKNPNGDDADRKIPSNLEEREVNE
jgi:hypothetical protein